MNIAGIIAKYLAISFAIEEGGQTAASDQQLLADFNHFQNFGRIAVKVHDIGSFLGRGCTGIHGQAHICLCQRGSIVGAVAGHGNNLAFRLLLFDHIDLILRFALGNETINTCFFCNGSRGKWIIAGAHDGFDTNRTQPLKRSTMPGFTVSFR